MRLFLDIETYSNYLLVLFMTEDGKAKRFEIFNDDDSGFDPAAILCLMTHPDVELITFNGVGFDIPLLTYALVTQDTRKIKKMANRFIEMNVKPWHFYRDEGLQEPKLNHIDIINVAPGMVSLKLYGGRLNSPRLQELPIEHSAEITEEQVPILRQYCKNDTQVTQMLYKALSKQVDLRRAMSKEYGVDLRSKSDAQIAEAVLKAEYTRRNGSPPPKVVPSYDSFLYVPPSYVRFSTPQMQAVFDVVRSAEMNINRATGHVKMPKEIEKLTIEIGDTRYKIGIGGLHSQESEVAHFTDDDHVLIDRDVESYYPRMMLNMNMQPGGFGDQFNPVYGAILEERLEAKHRMAELLEEKGRLEKMLDEIDNLE